MASMKTSIILFVTLVTFLLALINDMSLVTATSSVGCRDESGSSVAWWAMLKLPYLPTNPDPVAASGYGYLYADVNSPSLSYTKKYLNVSEPTGALASTLEQIFAATSSVGYFLYDDEHPDGSEASSFGHTKGAVAFNSEGGFWLIHSVPRFPVFPASSYQYPEDEKEYGQSFLCLSMSLSNLNTAAGLMLYNKPSLFASNMPSSLTSKVPNIAAVIAGNAWITKAGITTASIQTVDGTAFTQFAKNSEWNSELYEYGVAPTLSENLYVESWMNGVGPIPTFCKPTYEWDVQDIRDISFGSSISWSETQDHSKWAITQSSTILCIGDINRQEGQYQRGGGTVCWKSSTMWKSFDSLISKVDPCSK
eukprot:TRINITY_DN2477_c0_g2_i1.p1 TRINITY_DN2477_c0_g2~~TRINITY_DN2477_c0_g2_i1.p1  ORF type:complete len:365 (-),score=65.55 TRINITY_DN2477_c0_g2_i1:96-1190(-)